jgi:hypothetical protein
MREVPPVSMEGRTFQRFLAQNAAAGSLLRVDVPRMIGPERQRVYEGVGALVVAAMLVALLFAARRARPRWTFAGARSPRSPTVAAVESPSQALVRAIADLDAAFERASPQDTAARAAYEQQRARLKRQLANALAAERQPA